MAVTEPPVQTSPAPVPCDGAGPHYPGEIRKYPIGGGANLLLCMLCWADENKYRFERATVDPHTGLKRLHPMWDEYPQHKWYDGELVGG